MANLMDYMAWRGEFGFEVSSWNDVDALMMANLCYLNFHGIDDQRGWTIAEAKRLDLVREKYAQGKIHPLEGAPEISEKTFDETGSFYVAAKCFMSRKLIWRAKIIFWVKKLGWFYFRKKQ